MTDIVGNSLSEVLTGNYEAKIQNYSKLDKTVGASISSPTINLLGRQWKLTLYLGGNTNVSKEYISIYLNYEQGNSEVTATATFTLIDQANKKPQSIKRRIKESTFGINGYVSSNWGFRQFVKQSLLTDANSPFIVDDTVKILVEIAVTNNANSSDLEAIAAAEIKTEPILTNLYESGLGSDVSVVIMDATSQVSDRIPAHKCILMARSPVFKAMFTHNMSESNTNEIVISDFSPEVVREMLHFMYTDTLQSRNLNNNTVYEGLLGAAIKYDEPALEKLCEVHFCKQLTDSRVLGLVRLANDCGSVSLKQKCVSYVKNNAERLLKGRKTDALLGIALDALVPSVNVEVGKKRKAGDCESNGTPSDDSDSSSSSSGSSVHDSECIVM